MATRADESLARLYEDDFGAWVEGQVRALRALAASGALLSPSLDLPRLIEEVEDLRTTERHAVEGHMIVIVSCLLRLEYSPAAEPRRRWEETVDTHRFDLGRRPTSSLEAHLRKHLGELYTNGRRLAASDMGRWDRVDERVLPGACPYRFEQITDVDWWPRNRHDLGNP